MKVIDTRDGTTLEGVCVAVLPAHKDVSEFDMKRFYRMGRDHRAYSIMSRAQPQERLVLQRYGGVDPATNIEGEPSYYIVPCYPFYRVEQ